MPLYTCTKVNASLQFLKPSWDKKGPFEQMFLQDIATFLWIQGLN